MDAAEVNDQDLDTIETKIPARLDRLPWAKFHWMVIIGLGTVWILDGLEVTLVGSIGSRLTEHGSGLTLSAGQLGTAASIYVAGAVVGALFFGKLTDRFGRKKLFLITLGLYIAATIATAFSFAPWYFFLCRFFTGAGIGGEYSAINSAIDELIPARVRGRVDLIINGSYWMGAALAALASIVLLDTSIFAQDFGWRLAFGLGAVLGLTILVVRRHVPESPRWLFIHGRKDEADRIVNDIEEGILDEVDEDSLEEPDETLKVEQRKTVPLREIARTAFSKYPRRTILGISLFVGQAFLYNAVTFDLGTLLGKFYGIASGSVPIFIAIYAFSNFLGPVTLGRFFDTIGRKPMIVATYGLASVGTLALGILFTQSGFNVYWFMALLLVVFFFASAGASSAYLTVSEIFPMETRALAIAFFYAVGTGLGGIVGPILFGHLIDTGDRSMMALGFFIGAGVMSLGALSELFFGVKAENKSLEDVAEPLSASGGGGDEHEEKAGREADEGDEDAKAPDTDRKRSGQPEERRSRRSGRYRLGPGRAGMTRAYPLLTPEPVDNTGEVEAVVQALRQQGPMKRVELAHSVGARRWGPGRFSAALERARRDGQVRRRGRRTYEVA